MRAVTVYGVKDAERQRSPEKSLARLALGALTVHLIYGCGVRNPVAVEPERHPH
jgi:hypothetical protein